jgi:hypothetical protein
LENLGSGGRIIKIDTGKIGRIFVDWIIEPQDKVQWRIIGNTVTNLVIL